VRDHQFSNDLFEVAEDFDLRERIRFWRYHTRNLTGAPRNVQRTRAESVAVGRLTIFVDEVPGIGIL